MNNLERLNAEEMAYINEVLDRVEQKLPEFMTEATNIFMEGFGSSDVVIEEKAPQDYVTAVDKKIELRFREWVAKNYPQHSVYGEEFKFGTFHFDQLPDWLWAIDPVDATTNYAHSLKLPMFENDDYQFDPKDSSIVISLRYRCVPVMAMVSQPAKQQEYFARVGNGVYKNGKKIEPILESRLDHAKIVVSNLTDNKRMDEWIGKLKKQAMDVYTRNSSLAEVCDVISAVADVNIGYRFGPHEWPAAQLLAEESGCIIRPLEHLKEEFNINGMGERSFVMATNQSLFDQIRPFISLPQS